MVQWSDSFWGEGNRGFEVLYSNIKNGAVAIEEFQRFLSESIQCESAYSKNLSRLQTQFLKISNLGTFNPIWNLIRDLLDRVTSTHSLSIKLYQDLFRDIHNYQELYQKKVKTQIQKDGDINRTVELISQLSNYLLVVNKSKEQYHSLALECERLRRNGPHGSNTSSLSSLPQDNTSTSLAQSAMNSLTSKHFDRVERKCRQAQDEYRLTIEKYNIFRNDYEKRFSDAASKFQAFEIDHIERMLAFSLNYADIIQRNNEQIHSAGQEFTEKLKSLTGNELLDAFVEQKKTGTDRPSILQFEDVDRNKSVDVPSNSNETTLLNLDETNMPTFEANFSIPSTPIKQTDTTPRSTHSPSIDTTLSTQINPVTSGSPNQTAVRPQESNEQTNHPFIVMKKSKLPAIFGSRRKRDKSLDQKPSTNNKSSRVPRFTRSHTKTSESNAVTPDLTDFTTIADSNTDTFVSEQSKHTSIHSSSSVSNDDARQNHHRFTSSKSSSSSDSSDDDDDNMMTKITFTINKPVTQILSDNDDDDARIMNAMRNLGLNSRLSNNTNQDMNKSTSAGLINTRVLPPPPLLPVSRSTIANPNHTATDLFDAANIFPPQDQFAQFPSNTTAITNQDSPFFPSQSIFDSMKPVSHHLSVDKFTTSSSSIDDDTEVANSFPTTDISNKGISFPVLQVPRSFQTLRQQARTNAISPSVISMNQNFRNSPIAPNEIGTSPLTMNANDQIPLAIAFQETIHAKISGDNRDNWKSRIVGQMLISFPSSILNLLIDPSCSANTLEFHLKNLDNIENIVVKPSLIIQNQSETDSPEHTYSFDMNELHTTLRNLQDKSPTSAFFNLNVLNYELKESDVSKIPFELTSQWTRTFDTIAVDIKYEFHSTTLPDSICFQNNTVIVYTIITDGQQLKESSPAAEWSENEHKLWWKIPYVHNGKGQLSATVMTMQNNANETNGTDEQPLTTSSILKVYFIGENALFSSIDFDLLSNFYRISLLKKKILSGKYQSEPDQSEPIHFFKRPSKLALPNTN